MKEISEKGWPRNSLTLRKLCEQTESHEQNPSRESKRKEKRERRSQNWWWFLFGFNMATAGPLLVGKVLDWEEDVLERRRERQRGRGNEVMDVVQGM